ncbi:sphingolipid delta-4 desaturase [Pseudohyphozyma bogoriensis]|nr:sphingolipid delta-4 desaturase [Pseudohyphozyma bogoriensis]
MAAQQLDFSLFGGAEIPPPSLSTSTSTPASTSASSTAGSEDEMTATDMEQDGEESKANKYRLAGEEWAPRKVVPEQDPNDWLWMMTEEPHRSRRKAILKAHPEVRKLMGAEPLTKWVVLFVTILQFSMAYLLRNTSFKNPWFLLATYVIGGTANQNTFLAIHEITHNLAFKGVKTNRVFAIAANLPIGVPFAMMFKKYHIEHHKYLGEDGMDTDMPSRLELLVLRNVAGKAFFATFQIFFYALRPGFIRYQAPTRWIALNMATQFFVDYLIVKFWGVNALMYFLISSFMAGSLHPVAGHFIAEHYLFDGHDQETWSYYGPLNILAYNVGYHNEHHDFPSVPWTKLPELRRIAKEFYDPLPNHPSWPGVTYRFIFDPTVGMWSRARREGRNGAKGGDGGGQDNGTAGGLKDE